MDLQTARQAAELIQVLDNRNSEFKHVLREFDNNRHDLPGGDIMTLSINDQYGSHRLMDLEGDGEIAMYRQFLAGILHKRIQDAERDVYGLHEPEAPHKDL